MITNDNLKCFIETIEIEDVKNAIDAPQDYILLEAHIFNVGGYATIQSIDYNEDTEQEANDNGNLFLSKDDFLMLTTELEIFEF